MKRTVSVHENVAEAALPGEESRASSAATIRERIEATYLTTAIPHVLLRLYQTEQDQSVILATITATHRRFLEFFSPTGGILDLKSTHSGITPLLREYTRSLRARKEQLPRQPGEAVPQHLRWLTVNVSLTAWGDMSNSISIVTLLLQGGLTREQLFAVDPRDRFEAIKLLDALFLDFASLVRRV